MPPQPLVQTKTDKNRRAKDKKKEKSAVKDEVCSADDVDAVDPMDECVEISSLSSGSVHAHEPAAKLSRTADADSASASASAAPVAEPTLMEIMAAINSMNLNVGQRFDSVDSRLDGNDRKFIEISAEFKNYKDEVNAKFAAIAPTTSAWPAAAARKPAPPWAAPGAGSPPASSYYTTAAAPAALKTPPWASPAQTSAAEFGSTIYALGFPRKLPRLALLAFWEEEVVAKVPGHLVSGAKFQGGPAKHFSVQFPSREAARLFTATVNDRSLTTECRWTSPRETDEGPPALISFRVERTVAVRDRGRVLSKSWALLQPFVTMSRAWLPGMKLTTDSSRGTIAIVSAKGRDMWELVELKAVGDGYSVTAFEANLLIFGVGPATAEAIRASASSPKDPVAAPAAPVVAAAPADDGPDL